MHSISLPKIISFYLPQFYSIPAQGDWLVKSFYDCCNIGRTRPSFDGQKPPRTPIDFPLYERTFEEIHGKHTETAQKNGIYGFCYYFPYGKKDYTSSSPLQSIFKKPSCIPFCLSLVNEDYEINQRDHKPKESTKIDSADYDISLIKSILPLLSDKKYIKVEKKLLLLVHTPDVYADIKKTIQRWRKVVIDAGLGELYLVQAENFLAPEEAREQGFDASYEQPLKNPQLEPVLHPAHKTKGRIFSYEGLIEAQTVRQRSNHKLFRNIMPAWDTAPRKGHHADILAGSSPALFQILLKNMLLDEIRHNPTHERFVFISSWNHWGDDAVLEPCTQYGYAYLNSVKSALDEVFFERDLEGTRNIIKNLPIADCDRKLVLLATERAESYQKALSCFKRQARQVVVEREALLLEKSKINTEINKTNYEYKRLLNDRASLFKEYNELQGRYRTLQKDFLKLGITYCQLKEENFQLTAEQEALSKHFDRFGFRAATKLQNILSKHPLIKKLSISSMLYALDTYRKIRQSIKNLAHGLQRASRRASRPI